MIMLIKWFSKLLVRILLISIISISVSWTMLNLYVDKLFTQLNMPDHIAPVKWQDVLSQVTGGQMAETDLEQQSQMLTEAPASVVSPVPYIEDDVESVIETNVEDNLENSEERPDDESALGPKNALPVWGQVQSQQDVEQNVAEQGLVISADDFNRKKDLLSNQDKMDVFTILFSKLPEAEMQRISAYIEDGVTTEELNQAEAIVEKYVTKEEFAKLMHILNKY